MRKNLEKMQILLQEDETKENLDFNQIDQKSEMESVKAEIDLKIQIVSTPCLAVSHWYFNPTVG